MLSFIIIIKNVYFFPISWFIVKYFPSQKAQSVKYKAQKITFLCLPTGLGHGQHIQVYEDPGGPHRDRPCAVYVREQAVFRLPGLQRHREYSM